MNYQGEGNFIAGATTTGAGIALLPNTGEMPILKIVAVAALITGVTLILLQIGVWMYRRKNSS